MGREISVETLIAIAKENINNELFSSDLDDITKFILTFKVKAGKNKVMSDIAYKAYKVWSDKPVTHKSFGKLFSKHFESNKSSSKNYYLLNYQPAQLLNEAEKWKKEE